MSQPRPDPSLTLSKRDEVAWAICHANCITAHRGDVRRAQCQADNGWDMWLAEADAALVVMGDLTPAMRKAAFNDPYVDSTWSAIIAAASA